MREEVWARKQTNRLDSAWREFPRWAQHPHTHTHITTTSPPHCKNMDWPLLSKGGQVLFISSCKVAELPQQQRGEANAGGLLNYERWARVISLIESKEAGSDPHGMRFGRVVVNYIWASSWNLQRSGKKKKKEKLSKQACFYFGAQIIWAGQERLILASGDQTAVIQTDKSKVCSNGEQTWHLEAKYTQGLYYRDVLSFVVVLWLHGKMELCYSYFFKCVTASI